MKMQLRRLPNVLKPQRFPFETPESYAYRLEICAGIDSGLLTRFAMKARQEDPNVTVRGHLCQILEDIATVPKDDFNYEAEELWGERAIRLACFECADGKRVQVIPHIRSFCCHHHRTWTGPQAPEAHWQTRGGYTPPDPSSTCSVTVSKRVLDADRQYIHLQDKGKVHPGILAELAYIVTGKEDQVIDPDNFVVTIKVLALISNSEFQRDALNPFESFTLRAQFVEAQLHREGIGTTVAQRLWLFLRPAMLTVREFFTNGEPGRPGPISLHLSDLVADYVEAYPLEPFGRALEPLEQPDGPTWLERHLLPGQFSVPRRNVRQSVRESEFICTQGHRYSSTPNTAMSQLKKGRAGCPYCAGYAALPGYNSMEETHPLLAQQWHPEKNGGLRPSDIMGGSADRSIWWICQFEHSWQETPGNRTRGDGCPFCSRHRVIPGEASLDVTHPHLAEQWHEDNELTPQEVSAGSGHNAKWRCNKGHAYQTRIENRKNGKECPVCTSRRLLSGYNDLATTHPKLAEEWDHVRNAPVRPDEVFAGTGTKYWWICARGHSYSASGGNRLGERACPYCGNRRVLTGFNDVATRYPAIATEWDPEKNGEATAHTVLPGSAKRWWRCREGHETFRTVYSQVKSSGCIDCPKHRRVGNTLYNL